MLQFALAAFSVVLVAVAPGAAIQGVLRPSVMRDPVLWFTASPPLSLAILFTLAQLLTVLGQQLIPWLPILIAGTVVIGGLLRVGVGRTRPAAIPSARDNVRRPRAIGAATSFVLLLVGVLVGLAVWGTALHGQPNAPPSRDGLYHGFFVRRIVETGSSDLSRILVTDPVTEEVAAGFYPLALHNAVALQHQLMGIDIGLALTTWTVMSAAVFLPAGLFVLVRRLVPDRPLAAGFTALVAPFFAMFPYRPAAWSAITLIVALALTPVVLVLVGTAADADAQRFQRVVPASLAVLGVISTHTSQLALLLILLAIIEVEELWRNRRDAEVVRNRVVNLALTGMVAAVFYVPSLVKLRLAASERAVFAERGYLRFADAFGSIIDFSFAMPGTQAALGALVLIGLWLATRDRRLGAWGFCLLATVALFLATAVSAGFWQVLRPFTQPWYYSSWRTSYQVAFVATAFAGYALAKWSSGLDAVMNRFQPRFVGFFGPALVAAAFCGAGWVTLLHQPVDIVRHAYESNARTKTSMQNAFDYLTEHTRPGEVVLNEERDGSAWMYATSGLNPLLAVYQYTATPQTHDRLYLATHIADFPDGARVRELVSRWGIRFVMVSDTGFIDEPPRVRQDDLIGNPAFEEVFAADGVHLFRIRS